MKLVVLVLVVFLTGCLPYNINVDNDIAIAEYKAEQMVSIVTCGLLLLILSIGLIVFMKNISAIDKDDRTFAVTMTCVVYGALAILLLIVIGIFTGNYVAPNINFRP